MANTIEERLGELEAEKPPILVCPQGHLVRGIGRRGDRKYNCEKCRREYDLKEMCYPARDCFD